MLPTGPACPKRTRNPRPTPADIVEICTLRSGQVSATLDSYLSGRRSAALPATIISALIFACCFGFYLFVERIDREISQMR